MEKSKDALGGSTHFPTSNCSDRPNMLVSPAIASNVQALTTGDFMGMRDGALRKIVDGEKVARSIPTLQKYVAV
jgi:hypothetical protein